MQCPTCNHGAMVMEVVTTERYELDDDDGERRGATTEREEEERYVCEACGATWLTWEAVMAADLEAEEA